MNSEENQELDNMDKKEQPEAQDKKLLLDVGGPQGRPEPSIMTGVIGSHAFNQDGLMSSIVMSMEGKEIVYSGVLMVNLLQVSNDVLQENLITFSSVRRTKFGEGAGSMDKLFREINMELYNALMGTLQRGFIELDVPDKDNLTFTRQKVSVVGCMKFMPRQMVPAEGPEPIKNDKKVMTPGEVETELKREGLLAVGWTKEEVDKINFRTLTEREYMQMIKMKTDSSKNPSAKGESADSIGDGKPTVQEPLKGDSNDSTKA